MEQMEQMVLMGQMGQMVLMGQMELMGLMGQDLQVVVIILQQV